MMPHSNGSQADYDWKLFSAPVYGGRGVTASSTMADTVHIPANEELHMFQSIDNRRVLSSFTFKLVLGLSLVNLILWITSITLQIFLLTAMDRSNLYILVCLSTCWSILLLITTAVSSFGLLANRAKDVKGHGFVTSITTVLSLLIFIFHVVTLSLDTFDWLEEGDSNWTVAGSFTIFTGLFVAGVNVIVLKQMLNDWRRLHKEVEFERAEKIQQYLKAKQNNYINQLQEPAPLDELEMKERAELEERLKRLEQMESRQTESNYMVTAAQFLRAAEEDTEEHFYFTPPVFV